MALIASQNGLRMWPRWPLRIRCTQADEEARPVIGLIGKGVTFDTVRGGTTKELACR